QVILYPNPSKKEVFIESEATIKHIIIMDSNGQSIYKQAINLKQASFRLDKSGIYLVFIQTNKGTRIQKCLIQ
ncbi:MAG: T9SS type A sorting domain-containing protein, partial [Bacteroidota bacterium]